jgi:hypothetical protein
MLPFSSSGSLARCLHDSPHDCGRMILFVFAIEAIGYNPLGNLAPNVWAVLTSSWHLTVLASNEAPGSIMSCCWAKSVLIILKTLPQSYWTHLSNLRIPGFIWSKSWASLNRFMCLLSVGFIIDSWLVLMFVPFFFLERPRRSSLILTNPVNYHLLSELYRAQPWQCRLRAFGRSSGHGRALWGEHLKSGFFWFELIHYVSEKLVVCVPWRWCLRTTLMKWCLPSLLISRIKWRGPWHRWSLESWSRWSVNWGFILKIIGCHWVRNLWTALEMLGSLLVECSFVQSIGCSESWWRFRKRISLRSGMMTVEMKRSYFLHEIRHQY